MTAPTKTNPVIFIHGLWIHSAAWEPWIELFESRGYSAQRPAGRATAPPSPPPGTTPMPSTTWASRRWSTTTPNSSAPPRSSPSSSDTRSAV